ncbi:MAG TPA: hypothetical protein VHQ65_04440 [Thermoanaerobaculia bacterium]|nr:hypothetical protein [Thermoanaerobaculia bacterium]
MAEAKTGAPAPLEDGPADGRAADAEAASPDTASAAVSTADASAPGRDDTAWLENLEQRVHQAVERLRELAADNQRLVRRVAELEAAAAREEAVAATPDGAEAWQRERREIRRRVESLTDTLESLLPR